MDETKTLTREAPTVMVNKTDEARRAKAVNSIGSFRDMPWGWLSG